MNTTTTHKCSTHKPYRLSCEDFDTLVAQANGRCQRCTGETPRPEVDHDHALGMAGVRGLICRLCNARLGRVDAGLIPTDDADLAYLSRAWHLRYAALPYVADNRTPVRTVRVDEELWQRGVAKAKRRRETLSQILKSALVAYTEQHATEAEREQATAKTEEAR